MLGEREVSGYTQFKDIHQIVFWGLYLRSCSTKELLTYGRVDDGRTTAQKQDQKRLRTQMMRYQISPRTFPDLHKTISFH